MNVQKIKERFRRKERKKRERERDKDELYIVFFFLELKSLLVNQTTVIHRVFVNVLHVRRWATTEDGNSSSFLLRQRKS